MNFFQKLWNQFLTASRQLCGDKYTLQTVKTNTPAPPMTSQELQNNSAAKLRCAAAKQKTDTRLRSTNTQARCDSVGLALDLLEIDTDCGQVFPPQDVEQFHKRAGVMMQACSYLHGGDKDPGAHCVEALDDMNNLVRSDIQDGYCHPALNEMYQEKVIAACRNIHGPFFRSLIRWEKSLIAISKAWAKTCRERLKKD